MKTKILLVLFLNSVCLSQEKYISECFHRYSSGDKVSLYWNSEILFIPEYLKIKTSIKEITINNEENTYESIIYIKKGGKTPCEENYLEIPNFMREESSLIHIKVDVLFIDYIIDHFEFKLRPNFNITGYFNYQGFNNILGISLEFSKTVKEFKKIMINGVILIPTAPYIKSQKLICMRIMNVKGDHIFQTDYVSLESEERSVNLCNLLKISSYKDVEMRQTASHIDYVTEIHECDENVQLSPIKIFVDNLINAIEIQFFSEVRNQILYKMKIERQGNAFIAVTSPGYNSKLFDAKVEEEVVERAWYKRKEGLLHFEQRRMTKKCIVDQKEIEFDVIVYNESTYILNSRIEITPKDENVSYYIYATYKEKEKCLKQIIE